MDYKSLQKKTRIPATPGGNYGNPRRTDKCAFIGRGRRPLARSAFLGWGCQPPFEKCTDLQIVKEILLFIENLEGITGVVKSDHILNLFQELEGKLPEDKGRMMGLLRSFLEMEPEQQCLYQVGRRLGVFTRLEDMNFPQKMAIAQATCRQYGVTPGNVDQLIDEAMKRFV